MLDLERVGANDDFFALGGVSLSALEIAPTDSNIQNGIASNTPRRPTSKIICAPPSASMGPMMLGHSGFATHNEGTALIPLKIAHPRIPLAKTPETR